MEAVLTAVQVLVEPGEDSQAQPWLLSRFVTQNCIFGEMSVSTSFKDFAESLEC